MGDCCFTVAMQEAYKVSKPTFASHLTILSNVEKLHMLVFLSLEVRTTFSFSRLFVLSLINT